MNYKIDKVTLPLEIRLLYYEGIVIIGIHAVEQLEKWRERFQELLIFLIEQENVVEGLIIVISSRWDRVWWRQQVNNLAGKSCALDSKKEVAHGCWTAERKIVGSFTDLCYTSRNIVVFHVAWVRSLHLVWMEKISPFIWTSYVREKPASCVRNARGRHYCVHNAHQSEETMCHHTRRLTSMSTISAPFFCRSSR